MKMIKAFSSYLSVKEKSDGQSVGYIHTRASTGLGLLAPNTFSLSPVQYILQNIEYVGSSVGVLTVIVGFYISFRHVTYLDYFEP